MTFLLIEIAKYRSFRATVVGEYEDLKAATKAQELLKKTVSTQYPCEYIVLESTL